ncbi:antiterminator Q family protein [Agarilytica rhodophyticola]|uniref:antiterminator Q family protein n=1 Tax=Agarilytica rhodophyticola TaxID=1737490 RepID=UPI000B342DB2|nr:antiterminator Q family protein [Agarilytica rhodophyticola]
MNISIDTPIDEILKAWASWSYVNFSVTSPMWILADLKVNPFFNNLIHIADDDALKVDAAVGALKQEDPFLHKLLVNRYCYKCTYRDISESMKMGMKKIRNSIIKINKFIQEKLFGSCDDEGGLDFYSYPKRKEAKYTISEGAWRCALSEYLENDLTQSDKNIK